MPEKAQTPRQLADDRVHDLAQRALDSIKKPGDPTRMPNSVLNLIDEHGQELQLPD